MWCNSQLAKSMHDGIHFYCARERKGRIRPWWMTNKGRRREEEKDERKRDELKERRERREEESTTEREARTCREREQS